MSHRKKGNDPPADTASTSSSSTQEQQKIPHPPQLESFTTTITPSGTSVQITAHNSWDMLKYLENMFQAGGDGLSSTPPNDPMLSSSLGIWNTQATLGREFFPSSQLSLPQLSASQLSMALTSSQHYRENDDFRQRADQLHEFLLTMPNQGNAPIQSDPNSALIHFNQHFFPMEAEPTVFLDLDFVNQEGDQGDLYAAVRAEMHTPATLSRTSISSANGLNGTPEDLGFSVTFPDCTGKDWVFVHEKKLLCVKAATLFDMELVFLKKAPPTNSLLTVKAVFGNQGRLNKSVGACVKHTDGAYLFSDNKHCVKPKNGVAALVLPLNPQSSASKMKTKKGWKMPFRVGVRCLNSCFGSKTAITLDFAVTQGDTTLAEARINVRGCACPDRDAKDALKTRKPKGPKVKLEETTVDGRGHKRKKSDRTHRDTNLSVGGAPFIKADPNAEPPLCNFPKRVCIGEGYGVQQQYGQNSDGSYFLQQHCRAPPGAHNKIFLDGLVTNGQLADRYYRLTLPQLTTAPPPIAAEQSQIKGLREPVFERSTSDVARLEIKKWLREVVGSSAVSEDVFIENGAATLDAIFKLRREELETIMGGEFVEETVEKYWYHVKQRQRPLPPPRIPKTESQAVPDALGRLPSIRPRRHL
ncbi:hypothetical protein BV898_01401 [Hypsibius exemplaris]|uniref:p53 DNA-binding domain-containing protein n=1 Tax=Hypsibius exemplaris TaxID=2072580 RepID=A0A1W0XC23_HYPEX|nr:hypothetical protein BV898_01401 [Hypsibius exemplaris]